MLYIADTQRFVIKPMGGGKCVESHRVIKKLGTKIRKKFGKRKSHLLGRISYMLYIL